MSKPLAWVIEDDPDLAEIFSLALRGGGFETEIFRDGRAADERLAGTPPAVIVLDLHLPHVRGTTLMEKIYQDKRFERTAVIITTADAQEADRLRSRADLVLLKPVSIDQLRELAKRMLHRWQATADSSS